MKAWTYGRSGLLAGLVLAFGLLAGWGGRAWADPVVGTAQTVTGTSLLNSVTCPTATLCIGVGFDSSETKGVVVPLTVSGKVTAGTAKPVTGSSELFGIACPTATLCLAVGSNGANGV